MVDGRKDRKSGRRTSSVHRSDRVMIGQIIEDRTNPQCVGKYNLHFAINPGEFFEYQRAIKYVSMDDIKILSKELNAFLAGKSIPVKEEKYNRFADLEMGE